MITRRMRRSIITAIAILMRRHREEEEEDDDDDYADDERHVDRQNRWGTENSKSRRFWAHARSSDGDARTALLAAVDCLLDLSEFSK